MKSGTCESSFSIDKALPIPRRRRIEHAIAGSCALAFSLGCAPENAYQAVQDDMTSEPEAALDYHMEMHLDKFGRVSARRVNMEKPQLVPSFSAESLAKQAAPIAAKTPILSEAHPVLNTHLANQIRSLPGSELVDVVFTVKHDTPFTRLQPLVKGEPRDSVENSRRQAVRGAQIEDIERRRAPSRQPLVAMTSSLGGQIVEEHTVGNSVTARLPAARIAEFARHPSVLEVSARFDQTPPPNVGLGRTALASDAWRNAGFDGDLDGFYVGLLDSGVRATHQQFTSQGGGALGLSRDCVYGNSSCTNSPVNANYNTQDPFWGHGTGVAAIIMGGLSNWGANFVGVSRVDLDYLNVYTHIAGATNNGLDSTAVTRAFTRALTWGDDVIVAEVQSRQTHSGPIAFAADDAFDAGVAVIGATGNAGIVTSPAAPGNAHKALGIGDYDAVTNNTGTQVSGIVDSRIKPDIQGPTNVATAHSQSNTAQQATFNGTSGATAFAGGAMAVMLDWYKFGFPTFNPGMLYSGILAQGDQPTKGSLTVGNGRLRLNSPCSSWYSGSVTLNSPNVSIVVTANVGANFRDLRAAIWWPEGNSQAHNDVDLQVRTPNGTSMGISDHGGSVWERVSVPGNLTPGAWTATVFPYPGAFPRTPQQVFYTIVVTAVSC